MTVVGLSFPYRSSTTKPLNHHPCTQQNIQHTQSTHTHQLPWKETARTQTPLNKMSHTTKISDHFRQRKDIGSERSSKSKQQKREDPLPGAHGAAAVTNCESFSHPAHLPVPPTISSPLYTLDPHPQEQPQPAHARYACSASLRLHTARERVSAVPLSLPSCSPHTQPTPLLLLQLISVSRSVCCVSLTWTHALGRVWASHAWRGEQVVARKHSGSAVRSRLWACHLITVPCSLPVSTAKQDGSIKPTCHTACCVSFLHAAPLQRLSNNAGGRGRTSLGSTLQRM